MVTATANLSLVDRIASTDFSATPFGAREGWPQSLRTALGICLSSRFPMLIWWGPELRMLYNDAYSVILGAKHPASLGEPGQQVWPEIWPTIGPMLEGVTSRGEATWSEDQLLVLHRNGFAEETYFTWSFSPIAGDEGHVHGAFTATTETTSRVLLERRLSTLRELGAQVATASRAADTCETAVRTLGKQGRDIAFALIYLLDADGRGARLCASHGIPHGTAASPAHVAFDGAGDDVWSLAKAVKTRGEVVIDDVDSMLGAIVLGDWPEPVQRAVVMPVATNADEQPIGMLVVGTSPRLALDGPYRDFLRLATNHVASALTAAGSREEALHFELASLRSDADAVQRISNTLTAELDLDKLLQLITDEATQMVGAEFGAFFYNVIDENHESYTLSGVPREAFSKFPMPRNTHVFGPTFRGEGIVRVDDITKDQRYGKNPPYNGMPEGHLPVCSYLAAPVISRTGEVLGGLFFGHSQCGVFAERHERILTGIAAQGAVAIDNARLYDRVHELLESEREARAAAEQANRAKDEFLAVLGHELRNPLAPIQTALQLMTLRGDAQTKERLVIERQVGHLIRLVDDLLDVSRITRGMIELVREHVELSSVVTEAIEMASPLIEQKRHRLTVTVPRTGLVVDVDHGRMAQVFSNLLTNAAKYTPAGGEIVVEAKLEGASVCLYVQDNGIGIAADSIARVFEPFVQEPQALDRARGGLGLGLTIVRNFVELHGGKVAATSGGSNAGSTFLVRLPAVASVDVADDLRTTQPFRAHRANARRVLVVDDNVDAAELIVAALEALGHQAEVAHDGPSALVAAARLRPNIALLDIGLPVMDGYELARRLRELPELRDTRLIALTGYGTDEDRARSLHAGFDEHLIKPLALARLQEVLDAYPS